ncbi:MAG TPA: DUF1735 domain-containing protein [Chitinophagaceae bacterium]
MKLTIFRNLSLFMMLSLLITSCIKDDVVELKDQGSTFLKILEAPGTAFYFEPFSGTKSFTALSLRRDANSNAELNKPVTVTITLDQAAIDAYNDDNGTSFELLPDSIFTIGNEFTKVGDNTYQTTFAPGEFGKDFVINLNGSKWDLAHVYAMPFKIENSGGLAISSEMGESFAQISIKNKYDGVYEVTGSMTDLAVATITGYYPLEWDLVTSGENQVTVVDNVYLGIPGHIISSGGSLSYYGSFGLVVNFDPVTNKITSITNYYGQPSGNGRSAVLDPTGENSYDPATKTIKIKYNMLQPGTTIRTTFDETWTFVRPR